MTPIHDMVRALFAAGVNQELVLLAIRTAETCGHISKVSTPRTKAEPPDPDQRTFAFAEMDGGRLPVEWAPGPLTWSFARELGFTTSQIIFHLEAFRDYYVSQGGNRAFKSDWNAAFRVWLRRARMQRDKDNGRKRPDHRAIGRELADHLRACERGGGADATSEGFGGDGPGDQAAGYVRRPG